MAKRSMFVGMDVHKESIDVELVRPQLARRLARSAADLFVQTPALAEKHGVQLWDFRDPLRQSASASKDQRTYFTDDTAGTIQLFAIAADDRQSTPAQT